MSLSTEARSRSALARAAASGSEQRFRPGRRHDPRPHRRRPGAPARRGFRLILDAAGGHGGRGRGGRRRARRSTRPRETMPDVVADGRPHAAAWTGSRRRGGSAPRRLRPARDPDPDDVRPRRVRLRGAPRRAPAASCSRTCRARRLIEAVRTVARRRRAARAGDHAPADRALRAPGRRRAAAPPPALERADRARARRAAPARPRAARTPRSRAELVASARRRSRRTSPRSLRKLHLRDRTQVSRLGLRIRASSPPGDKGE